MKYNSSLIEVTLLKRYKRFLADVRLPDGKVVVAHVPNSGSMKGVSDPGSRCRVSVSDNLSRKLPHTLEMVLTDKGQWVGVNTSLTNKLVKEAFENKTIPQWQSFSDMASEVKINSQSRLDFLLSGPQKKRYVEVKNVSMALPPMAVFPDAVTERGQKHLNELIKLSAEGFEAEIFFVVQREYCKIFRPCDEIDPVYGKLLRQASKNVIVRCWSCSVSESEIRVNQELRIDLS